MNQPITNQQLKKIHALVSNLRLKDEWYRDTLYGYYKVESSKELTFAQACEYVKILEDMAVKAGVWKRPVQKYDHLENRPGMATPKQLRMISAMWKEVSYHKDPKKRAAALRTLLENPKLGINISDLAFLKKADVKQVIAIIKSMKKQREKKEAKIKKGA